MSSTLPYNQLTRYNNRLDDNMFRRTYKNTIYDNLYRFTLQNPIRNHREYSEITHRGERYMIPMPRMNSNVCRFSIRTYDRSYVTTIGEIYNQGLVFNIGDFKNVSIRHLTIDNSPYNDDTIIHIDVSFEYIPDHTAYEYSDYMSWYPPHGFDRGIVKNYAEPFKKKGIFEEENFEI